MSSLKEINFQEKHCSVFPEKGRVGWWATRVCCIYVYSLQDLFTLRQPALGYGAQ